MSELDEIIEMQVTVTDQAPERPTFGIPLIASFHSRFGTRVKEYSQPDELLDDGFSTGDPEYGMAVAIKAQDPTIQRFKLGRLTTTYTQIVHLIPTNVTVGYRYEFTIQGVSASYVVQTGDDVAKICDGIVEELSGIPGATASDGTTHVIVTASTAGRILEVKVSSDSHLHVLDATIVNGTSLTSDLNAIDDEDPNWYALLLAINTDDTILAAATWTETKTKIFVPQSADWNILASSETTDIASQLVGGAYTRTAGIWHRLIGGTAWAAAAFLTKILSFDPGAATPAFKTLATVQVDSLRTGERSALAAKRWTRYTRVGGLNITYEGRTPSGRFIDTVRGIDWIKSEIQLDLYRYLYVNPKVGFETTGLTGVRGVVENAIRKGITAQLVAADTPVVVNVPAIEDTDEVDRLNRFLRGVTFSFRLSGALHKIRVTGTVSA